MKQITFITSTWILLKQVGQTNKHFTCEAKEQQNKLQHNPETQYKLSFQNNKTTLQHSLTKSAHKPIFCKSWMTGLIFSISGSCHLCLHLPTKFFQFQNPPLHSLKMCFDGNFGFWERCIQTLAWEFLIVQCTNITPTFLLLAIQHASMKKKRFDQNTPYIRKA